MNWDDEKQTLICDRACWQLGTDEINRQLKEWFSAQSRVFGCNRERTPTSWFSGKENFGKDGPTHTAVLIGVSEIEREDAESVLRELVGNFARPPDTVFRAQYIQLIEKAKRILGDG